MTASSQAIQVTQIAAQAASDKLATDLVAFDVSDRLGITDIFLIVTGSNNRQVNAIVDNVEEQLHRAGFKPVRREGKGEASWVLLDYFDLVVHIQNHEAREQYCLDRLWRDCPEIEICLREPERETAVGQELTS